MAERESGQQWLGVHEARGALPSLVDAATRGQSTRIVKDQHIAVLAPLTRLGAEYEDLLPALASVAMTQARPKLGDLVAAAAQGVPHVLTRHGQAEAVLMADISPSAEPAVSARPRRELRMAGEVLQETPPAEPALSFGLPRLDAALAGARAGRLVVVAGEPGAGGSLLAVAAARTTALTRGRGVLYAASGLSRHDVMARMVAAEAEVNYQQLRSGTLPSAQQERVTQLAARIKHSRLCIDDGSDLSAEDIADSAGFLDDLALVVVDRLTRTPAAHLPLSGDALPGAAAVLAGVAARAGVPVLAVVDSADPALVASLEAEVTLTLSRTGNNTEVAITERDFGLLGTLSLHADLLHARFTEPMPPAPAAPSTASTPVKAPAVITAAQQGPDHQPPPIPPATTTAQPPHAVAAPTSDPTPARVPAPAEAVETAASPSSRVVRGESAPCELCGGPTPYRVAGRPQHMKGFCNTTAAAPAPVPAQAAVAPPQTEPRPGAWPSGTSRPEPPAAEEPAAHAAEAADVDDDGFDDRPEVDLGEEPGRFGWGPFVVLDGHGTAHLAGGRTMPCSATTVRELAAWAADRPIGTPRLKPNGRDGDPLIVLMAEAAARLGLPATADPEYRALPADHPALEELAAHGWEVPQRGGRPWFSAWVRVFQRVKRGRRSVQLAVLPWGALGSANGWPLPFDKKTKQFTSTVSEVVAFLTAYAERLMTPVASTAATGQELMTAMRPSTRAWRDEETKKVGSVWVEGSIHRRVDAAPCEVPPEHPLARGRNNLDPAQTLMEEALQWWRMPTEEERRLPYIVSFDINVAFGNGANGTVVGNCAPYCLEQVPFDKKLPGSWLYDLSGVKVDPRLPSPFTPDGRHSTGPAWYETRTIAYAIELGFVPSPTRANVRPNEKQALALNIQPHPEPEIEPGARKMPPVPPFGNGPYLKFWYEHLTVGYLTTYARLGIKPDMGDEKFMEAMARLTDPAFRKEHATDLLVLAAIKSTFKGAIGKLRERPHDTGRRGGDPHAPWKALDRALWRPDIRAAVISRSRTGMHRKIVATAKATGAYPLAVQTDCISFASPTPDLRWLMGHKSGFKLGPNPGYVKPEPVRDMDWYLGWAAKDINPARKIRDGFDAVVHGGE